MVGLSHNLIKRCRITLLKCEYFDNHVKLSTVFVVDELAYLKRGIPETATKNDRVNATIEYLLGKSSTDGRPAFSIFLAALRDLYEPDDVLCTELDALRSEIEDELNKAETIAIPVVIGAMTREEATALFSEAVFDDPSVAPIERERFQTFSRSLSEHGVADLAFSYGDHRETWKPHTNSEQHIDSVVYEIARRINEIRRGLPGLPLIVPQFLSSEFLGDNATKRHQIWNEVGRSGAVVIIDAVSLFHPALRQKLSQSTISSNLHAAILVVSPISVVTTRVNQLIENLIGSQMEMAFSRFDSHLDRLCEIGVGDLRTLQRWLYAILPEEVDIVQKQRPNPSNQRIIRERMAREPRGMDSVIFGQPVKK